MMVTIVIQAPFYLKRVDTRQSRPKVNLFKMDQNLDHFEWYFICKKVKQKMEISYVEKSWSDHSHVLIPDYIICLLCDLLVLNWGTFPTKLSYVIT